MSKRRNKYQIGSYVWRIDNPGRYAIFQIFGGEWAATRDGASVVDPLARPKSLAEAMDAAYADAEARAALVPTC